MAIASFDGTFHAPGMIAVSAIRLQGVQSFPLGAQQSLITADAPAANIVVK
jgi:hypothetical protein